MQNLLQTFLVGIYLGGAVALLPLAYVVRRKWRVSLLVSLGWPALLFGIFTGMIRFKGGVQEV